MGGQGMGMGSGPWATPGNTGPGWGPMPPGPPTQPGPYGPGARPGPYGPPAQPSQPSPSAGWGAGWSPPGGQYPHERPPRRGRGPWFVVGILTALVLVVGGTGAAIFVLSDSEDETTGDENSAGDDSTTTTRRDLPPVAEGTPGETSANPDEAVAVEVPADFVEAADASIPVSMRLPSDWVWAPLAGEATGVGDRLAPDDPTVAERIDQNVSNLPRGVMIIGMPAEAIGPSTQFFTNVTVMELPGAPTDTDELRELVVESTGDFVEEVYETSYVVGEHGPTLRMHFSIDAGGISLQNVQYWSITPDGVYTLQVAGLGIERYLDAADAMAASLRITG